MPVDRGERAGLRLLGALLLVLWANTASAQQPAATTAQADGSGAAPDLAASQNTEPEAEPEAAEPEAAEPEAEPEADEPGPAAPSADQLTAAAEAHQRTELTRQLRAVEAERDALQPLWPYSALGLGLLTIATGVVVGASLVFTCDDSCSVPFWAPGMVIGGSAITAGGLLWVRLHNGERAELDSRRYHIQKQLQYLDYQQATLRSPHSRQVTSLALRF